MTTIIEIDSDALKRLDDARGPEESYSAVIRRCVPQRRSIEEILKALRSGPSLGTLDAADESVQRRRNRPRTARA